MALGIEYAGVYGLTKVLPAKLKPIPLAVGSFLHVSGFLSHLDPMVGGFLPREAANAANFSVYLVTVASEELMSYADSLYNIANKLV